MNRSGDISVNQCDSHRNRIPWRETIGRPLSLSPSLSPCLPACFFLLWATDNNKNIAMIINIIQFLMSADKAEDIACKWKYARRSDSFAGLDASLPGMPCCLRCLLLIRRYIALSSVRWRLLLALPKRRQKSPEMGISIFHTHTQSKLRPSCRSLARQCTAKRCRRNCSTTEAQKAHELLHK